MPRITGGRGTVPTLLRPAYEAAGGDTLPVVKAWIGQDD
ncbi:hypothetical protein HDF16_005379 [Granulicella aggregans]|uniref:Uncharacterized protein n=1 Tax=Granulicella aggregans TaxID=474949 RepID=A0A7W7ZJ05_9BACT|nr:hypothetical protein [Granulicella aggregans]